MNVSAQAQAQAQAQAPPPPPPPARRGSRAVASKVAFAATSAVVAAGAALFAAPPAHADGGVISFAVTAQAPVLQATEDEPTSTFHPEGEGDVGYSYATLDPAGETALATLLWPGSAAGNAGTLVEVLGGPAGLSQLNDPVRAQATSGTPQTAQSTTTPAGTEMSATVQPAVPGDQYAAARSALAAGGLGAAGTAGASQSSSTIHFDAASGTLTGSASSSASNLQIDGGLVSIGSVTSTATATSVNGAEPQTSGATLIHAMSIAGQSAYVDGAGVHVGAPGAPAPPPIQDAVNTALEQAGMQIYFTSPTKVTIGQVNYYDASSVLFYWAPPGDSSHNSFTLSIGGAGVSMTAASSSLSGLAPAVSTGAGAGADTGNGDSGLGAAPPPDTTPTAPAPASPSAPAPVPTLSLPTGATPAVTSSQPRIAAPTPTGNGDASLASVSLPGGLGAGWWVLILAGAALGAALLSRVPKLVAGGAAGAGGCPNDAGNPSATRRGSSP